MIHNNWLGARILEMSLIQTRGKGNQRKFLPFYNVEKMFNIDRACPEKIAISSKGCNLTALTLFPRITPVTVIEISPVIGSIIFITVFG